MDLNVDCARQWRGYLDWLESWDSSIGLTCWDSTCWLASLLDSKFLPVAFFIVFLSL
jgi:hypothetical protein